MTLSGGVPSGVGSRELETKSFVICSVTCSRGTGVQVPDPELFFSWPFILVYSLSNDWFFVI
jgi:hypothetical protein